MHQFELYFRRFGRADHNVVQRGEIDGQTKIDLVKQLVLRDFNDFANRNAFAGKGAVSRGVRDIFSNVLTFVQNSINGSDGLESIQQLFQLKDEALAILDEFNVTNDDIAELLNDVLPIARSGERVFTFILNRVGKMEEIQKTIGKQFLENPAMACRGVSVHYNGIKALYDVTMDIGHNEVISLIGPSGCGKTTFLRCLNRMNDEIDKCEVTGTVSLEGTNIYDKEINPSIRRQFGDAEIERLVVCIEQQDEVVIADRPPAIVFLVNGLARQQLPQATGKRLAPLGIGHFAP